MPFVDHRELSLGASAYECHHSGSHGEPANLGATIDNDSRKLEARDVGRYSGGRGVASGSPGEVGAIEARGGHADED
jgi:hypothetical protein